MVNDRLWKANFGSGRFNHIAPDTPNYDLIPPISIPADALTLRGPIPNHAKYF